MPKRSNHYQKLMLYINGALAPTSASVTESAMLWDKETEQEREVDILIEDFTGPYPVKIAIECTERNRKLGTKDIEQLHAKHKNLGVGQTVIITNVGFVGPATKYANKNNIQLLTFDTALKLQWPSWLESFKGMSLTHVSFTCTGAHVSFVELPSRDFNVSSGLTLLTSEFGSVGFYDYVYARFQREEPEVLSRKEKGSRHWAFEEPIPVNDGNGIKAEISEIQLTYESLGANIPVQYGELNGSSFGYGISADVAPYKRMAIVASPSRELTKEGKPKVNLIIHVDTH